MALDYVTSKVDSITLVTLKGTIVAGESVDLLQHKTRELLDAGETNFILDLAGVTFVDSTGIGALIHLVGSASSKGGSLKLLHLTKRIHDVIQITRLSSVFAIYDDLQKAIESFAPEAEEGKVSPIAEPQPQEEEVVLPRRRLKTLAYDEANQEEPADRRKHHRWYIPVPVHVKGIHGDGSEFTEETVTADVSESGMGLLLTVPVPVGGQVVISAPEEKFESSATVVEVGALGAHMNRVHVQFPKQTTFSREAAEKKYVYDYSTDTWIAYMTGGTYYDTKHQPFGKVEAQAIVAIDSGEVVFRLRYDRIYDLRMNCIGHII